MVYDREQLDEYNRLVDLYFVGCLNLKAGSFNVDLRLQRHFSVFCQPAANEMIISQVYSPVLSNHLSSFGESFADMAQRILKGTIHLYQAISRDSQFNPSAKKFHYQFNLREISKVIQGVMRSDPQSYKGSKISLVRLWVHECKRVFHDRLAFEEDIAKFNDYLAKSILLISDSQLPINEQELKETTGDSNIFTSFISQCRGDNDPKYLPIKGLDELKQILTEKLNEYNDSHAQMNLVLFKNAMMHIARIARILEQSNGHALLVGVGGSGKQSLTKLTSFLLGYELESLPSGSLSINDFKTLLGDVIKKATKTPGSKRVFMITDLQIENEQMLIYINDLLNSGYIPGLWIKEELQAHLLTLKNEARMQGVPDTFEALFDFFVEKIKQNVHMFLLMSPVGDSLRIRARKFPALINSTNINWFHAWPQDALFDVARNFLSQVEFPDQSLVAKIAKNMAQLHVNIDQVNKQFLLQERRYNYTTPKSFLELIDFYTKKLSQGREDIDHQIDNLNRGLSTLSETQNKVKDIEAQLKVIMEQVEKQTIETQSLIEIVNKERKEASEQQAKANIEEEETQKFAQEANEVKKRAELAYNLAKPKLDSATEALNRISEQKITIMKNLKSPPAMVMLTGKVLAFIYKNEKVDLFSDKDNDSAWKKACLIMNNVKRFLSDLKAFSTEEAKHLDPSVKDKVKKLIDSGKFNVDDVMETSQAAGNIADWAHNIIAFNEAFNIVEPLEEQKNKAEAILNQKNKELETVMEKVRALN